MKKVLKNKQNPAKSEFEGLKKTKLKPLTKDKYKPGKNIDDDEDDELLDDDLFSYKDENEDDLD
jgi:hypothetical protein